MLESRTLLKYASMAAVLLAATSLTAFTSTAPADTIILKSGQKIVGQVLKTQQDTLFVDIGVDVVKIPV